jgi:hypothetical protein
MKIHTRLIVMAMTATVLANSQAVQSASSTAKAAPELRDAFFKGARPAISNLLTDTETRTGTKMVFMTLPDNDSVAARFIFDPFRQEAQIQLRRNWQDVDVAHELMHARMDLIDAFAMLAWRHDAARTSENEAAFGRLQTYVKDEVVHANLVKMGLNPDGEVLRPTLFDNLYADVTRYLDEGRNHANDGMAHLDKTGHGTLCRVCFLVQAELVLKNYGTQLPADRVEKTKRFIAAFRAHRQEEARKADDVLELFRTYDVGTAKGHREILVGWTKMEGLEKIVGPSSYKREASGRYVLPFPD